ERLHAWTVLIPEGKVVTSSSHRSARRTASTTSFRWEASTLGSPAAATACRATFLARSQLTGPPRYDIRSANCRRASANCWGSPNGFAPPKGPPGSGGWPPPPAPEPPPEPPGGRPEPPDPPGSPGRRSGSDGPKPNGRSVICPSSRAGWKGHDRHVISGAA